MKLYLGIDTSNYTTSIAVVNECGEIVADERILLGVEQGKRGLRQSDALFLHIKNLPLLFERFPTIGELCAVGVSSAPRRTEDSYMPVFLAGVNAATAIAATHRVLLYEFSHQEGHLRAGTFGLAQDMPAQFYAVHLSGGTTEILSVVREGTRYDCNIIGGTQDISAGQLVDRLGVRLGLSFPCGKELEKLANDATAPLSFKLSSKGASISFSGVEAQAMRAADTGALASDLAHGVLMAIADSLAISFRFVLAQYGQKPILLAGGVASNQLIRARLTEEFGATLVFAQPQYATDNAVGIALLAKEQMS